MSTSRTDFLVKKDLRKNVVILEVEGGIDKEPDGHRADTFPIINSLKERGWNADQVFYTKESADKLSETIKAKYDAVVSRVNPGDVPGGETKYLTFLRHLAANGVEVMPHPDVMINLGAKDALSKLNDTGLVPRDTMAYYSYEELARNFPLSLSERERVLKQNRGSGGEGIWRVSVTGDEYYEKGKLLPPNTSIKCTEAVDNHVEYRKLGKFMEFCKQYFGGNDGRVIDMRYLSRIKEGERRIMFVGETPVFVVIRQPEADAEAFSASSSAGATYTYETPDKYSNLIDIVRKHREIIYSRLDIDRAPLIWTADFILDWTDDGQDAYFLGELNCSCVGFGTQLNLGVQDAIADEIIRVLTD